MYDCRSPREIPAAGTIAFPFELRLDDDLANAAVTGTTVVPDDGVPANNVARFIINPSADTPSTPPSTPSATPTAAAGGAADRCRSPGRARSCRLPPRSSPWA
nr:hypothetical protein GCM10020092_096540 [Actinoplanes digitatis]